MHVTFSALNGDIEPSERILSLRPDRPRIHIGRASKSVNKGLEGAVDNAWFDSPVMSRNHAELSLGLEDNVSTLSAFYKPLRADRFLGNHNSRYRIYARHVP